MGNLFVVFTPLQLFVSQQIIRQEKLKNNVVILGWSSQFSDAYEMMYIEELWDNKIFIEDINRWGSLGISSFSDIKKCISNYKLLKSICNENYLFFSEN